MREECWLRRTKEVRTEESCHSLVAAGRRMLGETSDDIYHCPPCWWLVVLRAKC